MRQSLGTYSWTDLLIYYLNLILKLFELAESTWMRFSISWSITFELMTYGQWGGHHELRANWQYLTEVQSIWIACINMLESSTFILPRRRDSIYSHSYITSNNKTWKQKVYIITTCTFIAVQNSVRNYATLIHNSNPSGDLTAVKERQTSGLKQNNCEQQKSNTGHRPRPIFQPRHFKSLNTLANKHRCSCTALFNNTYVMFLGIFSLNETRSKETFSRTWKSERIIIGGERIHNDSFLITFRSCDLFHPTRIIRKTPINLWLFDLRNRHSLFNLTPQTSEKKRSSFIKLLTYNYFLISFFYNFLYRSFIEIVSPF